MEKQTNINTKQESQNEQLLWHYTTLEKLPLIIKDKFIDFGVTVRKKETRALWLSKNQHWEPSASKLLLFGEANGLDSAEQMAMQHEMVGIARIGIQRDADVITWGKFKHKCNWPKAELAALEQISSNHSDWYAMLQRCPIKKWKSVQVWNGSAWDDFDFAVSEDPERIVLKPVIENGNLIMKMTERNDD